MRERKPGPCPDCAAPIGEPHKSGCDVERCPMCGGQLISCSCIYEFCGMDSVDLEEEHPEIYRDGPTEEMYVKWDKWYLPRRIKWTGLWPGVMECREFGWYSKMVDGQGWVVCSPDDRGATENLNRLHSGEARWDVEQQRFVLTRPKPGIANGARTG